MDKREGELLDGEFLAHVDYETKRSQSVKEHFENVAEFSEKICTLTELKNIAYLTAVLHDAGKLSNEIQCDFKNIMSFGDRVHKHDMDHSTAGGRLINDLIENDELSELLSTVIYFHHGLSDCIDLKTGYSLQERRANKEIEYDLICERLFDIFDKKMIEDRCEKALADYRTIKIKIKEFIKQNKLQNRNCGNRFFFMGMYLRLLLSILIDSDWTDTAHFFQTDMMIERCSPDATRQIWENSLTHFENYLRNQIQTGAGAGKEINKYRAQISETCMNAADTTQRLYRLTVPTGAGKTLSGLRFALHHALKKGKQHIIYVAPFNSILIQNAEEIRKAVGNPEIVLEHHCNVVCKEEEEQRYLSLIETWDSPIIVTTAVQMLNVLFSDQKSFIRRMHTLCNSIIIFDEVQAIPVRCMELFNLAVNFLTSFTETTVVLCSATQPSINDIRENNMCPCVEMVGEVKKYEDVFKRVDIVDATHLYSGKMEVEDLRNFAIDKISVFNNVLIIVNTTACALNLYEDIKAHCSYEYNIFHLSNNMCPQHKLDTLRTIKSMLNEKGKKVICISTQVVEAGVDFSFGCVIRSKAGLDNVIQAAGRCNRHKEYSEKGQVYIVQMSKEAENLKNLPEIRETQAALGKVLDDFKSSPEAFKNTLDSQEAIKAYYKNYYRGLKNGETGFPAEGCGKTLVELLGEDDTGREQYSRLHKCKKSTLAYAQAFRTAGDKFEVISNDYKVNIVVPYNDEAKRIIAELSDDSLEFDERKRKIRILQRYTVGISKYRRDELNNAIYDVCDEEIQVLSEGYYDECIGVTDRPKMLFYNQ